MFTMQSTACLNNPLKNMGMHATTKRLFDALMALEKIDGYNEPGKVAQYLGESAATITNWKSRGISKPGILKVNKLLGIDPRWLEGGAGNMLPAASQVEAPNVTTLPAPALRGLAGALAEVQTAVDGLSPLLQDAGRTVLVKWMNGQASLSDVVATIEGLQQTSTTLMSGSGGGTEKRHAA